MEDRKRVPSRTNIDPRLAELDDSETSEFVASRDSAGTEETREFVFPRHRVSVEDASQLTVASDSVTVVSDSDVAADDTDEIFEPGLLLADRYEITEHVHTGGMGHLYKARDTRLLGDIDGAFVAVKVLRQRLVDRPDTRNLLEMEAARARQLSHPNVINVYDFDEHDGQFFLVMEWLDGKSVHELLQQTQGKRLDPSFAWRVIDGAARALRHAHENGVIHADVNPGNVFICDTQDIKLLDFGVARERSDDEQGREQSVWATPAYASPDVLDGRAPVLEDDVFSLGCVAYRLLAGQKPFGDLTSIEARRRDAEPPPIPGLDDHEWQLVQAALNFDRPARPSSVAGFLREGTPRAAAETIPAASAPAHSQTPPREAPGQPPSAEAPRSVVTWQLGVAAGAGAVAIAGTLIWAMWPSGDGATTAAAPPAPAVAETPLIDTLPQDAGLPVAIDTSGIDPSGMSGDGTNESGRAVVSSDSTVESSSGESGDVDLPAAASPAPVEPPAIEPVVSRRQTETVSTAPSAITEPEAAPVEEPALAAAADSASSAPEAAPDAPSTASTDAQNSSVAAEPEPEPEPAVAESADSETGSAAGIAAAGAATVAAAADATSPVGEPVADGAEATVATEPAEPDAPEAETTADPAADIVDEEPALATGDGAGESEETMLALENPAPGAENPAATPASGAKVEEPPDKVEVVPLSELGLERFVEPRYPRAARLREQAGFVDVRFNVYPNGTTGDIVTMQSSPDDVFVRSAEQAVSRWRFARRDDIVLAQVRLTFDPNR